MGPSRWTCWSFNRDPEQSPGPSALDLGSFVLAQDVADTFPIKRLFASQVSDGYNWKGAVGDVISLITDGSHARQIDTIRRELADRHGIALGEGAGGR